MKLIRFTATWCMPCKQLAPRFEDIAKELGIETEVNDVEETDRNILIDYEVQSIPAVFLEGENRRVRIDTGSNFEDNVRDAIAFR